jgi:ThiF family
MQSSTTDTFTSVIADTAIIHNKYDRQLRVWGSSGQQALSRTCLVLIRATAVGTETCKNCILPGIQHIHIVDDDEEDAEDNSNSNNSNRRSDTADAEFDTESYAPQYSSNFFVASSNNSNIDNTNNHSTSNCRAQRALQALLELNPDVTGSYTNAASVTNQLGDEHFYASIFQQLLFPPNPIVPSSQQTQTDEIQPQPFESLAVGLSSQNTKRFHQLIVVGSDLEIPVLQCIAKVCHQMTVPFLSVHAYGLIGLVQIQTLPIHPILNPRGQQTTTTNTASIPDLRILHPFPLLYEFMESFCATTFTGHSTQSSNIVPLSSYEYGQIPYPILLYYIYHKVWKSKYPTLTKPQTMEQKNEFVQMIRHHFYQTMQLSSAGAGTGTTDSVVLPIR